jgi:uncharacterized membrane protein YphA (DoxX/SURF4 family)
MGAADRSPRTPAYQAYLALRVGFVVLPILFGIDAFFNFMVYWPAYLASWIDRLAPGNAGQFMRFVGVVEIVAGILVLIWPKWGSLVVAAWLAGIIVNLLTFSPPQYYDIALRDIGLLLGALALNRLATTFGITTLTSEIRDLRRAR